MQKKLRIGDIDDKNTSARNEFGEVYLEGRCVETLRVCLVWERSCEERNRCEREIEKREVCEKYSRFEGLFVTKERKKKSGREKYCLF